MKYGLTPNHPIPDTGKYIPNTNAVFLQKINLPNRFRRVAGGILFLLWLGIGYPSLWAAEAEKEKPKKLTVEQMKKIIKDKNIFKPAKIPPPPINPDPENIRASALGPKPLKKPFTVFGIRAGEEEICAYLLFKDPERLEKVTEGQVFENTLKIVAIEWPFLRCEYAGQEVRIYQKESTKDALARLRGFDSSYILLGTRASGETGDTYVAEVLILSDNTVKTIEQGDRLGDATVIRIEEGKMILMDQDGTEFPIE